MYLLSTFRSSPTGGTIWRKKFLVKGRSQKSQNVESISNNLGQTVEIEFFRPLKKHIFNFTFFSPLQKVFFHFTFFSPNFTFLYLFCFLIPILLFYTNFTFFSPTRLPSLLCVKNIVFLKKGCILCTKGDGSLVIRFCLRRARKLYLSNARMIVDPKTSLSIGSLWKFQGYCFACPVTILKS